MGQFLDASHLFRGHLLVAGLAPLVAFPHGLLQLAQALVAGRFQRGRHQPVDRIHRVVAPLGQLGFVARLRDDADGPTVERLTEPTPLQQRALELVRAFPGDDKSSS